MIAHVDPLPVQHGPISCLSCFDPGSTPGCTVKRAAWRIDNNPGYWGAAAPEVLVLGFSKGANQRSVADFDQIAFANARENLAEILRALGLLDAAVDIDRCFTANGTKLGFASVIRCGLGLEVEPSKYATSGKVVRAAIAADSEVRDLFDRCTDRFLRTLPPSVSTVVFLGLDGPYVEALYERIRELHSNVRRLSELAYATDAVTFVHVIHPSPLATSHRQTWLRDDDTSLADKRREVAAALGKTSYVPGAVPRSQKRAAVADASPRATTSTNSRATTGPQIASVSGLGNPPELVNGAPFVDYERISKDGERYVPHLFGDGLYRVADPAKGPTKHHAHNQIAIRGHEIAEYLSRGYLLRMRGETNRQVNLISAAEIKPCPSR
jgi:hypothetical protein